MNTTRRALNAISALLLVLATVGLASFMSSGQSRSPIPLTFIGLVAGVPALAHLAASTLAWGASPSSKSTAVFGLACSCVSCFVWIVMVATLVELAITRPPISSGGYLLALFAGLLILPIASALNIAYFRTSLVAAPAE